MSIRSSRGWESSAILRLGKCTLQWLTHTSTRLRTRYVSQENILELLGLHVTSITDCLPRWYSETAFLLEGLVSASLEICVNFALILIGLRIFNTVPLAKWLLMS